MLLDPCQWLEKWGHSMLLGDVASCDDVEFGAFTSGGAERGAGQVGEKACAWSKSKARKLGGKVRSPLFVKKRRMLYSSH